MYGDEPTLSDTPPDLGLRQPATLNAMAALSLIFAFLFFPLGIVFGHVAKRQIERTHETGGGMATGALVISYLMLGLTVCLCCGGLYLFGPKNR
jgi:Domain of unknown function (DUF4190)